MNLERFIQLSSETEDVDQLYKYLEEVLVHECGYDRVIFSLMSDHPSLGLEAGHGIMRNYPDDWMKHYIKKGYENVDPVRRFGFRHVGPFIWDTLPLMMTITPAQNKCMNECKEAGFHNGAAILLRGVTGELGGIGVAMSSQKATDGNREANHKLGLLNVISQQFYAVFCRLHEKIQDIPNQEVVMTENEINVLKEMVMSRKIEAIASTLNMSSHNVDYYVRRILKKLKVPTKTAAIIKAINSGFLGLDHQSVWIRQSPDT